MLACLRKLLWCAAAAIAVWHRSQDCRARTSLRARVHDAFATAERLAGALLATRRRVRVRVRLPRRSALDVSAAAYAVQRSRAAAPHRGHLARGLRLLVCVARQACRCAQATASRADFAVISSLKSAEQHLARLTAEPHLAASARLVSIVGYRGTVVAIEAKAKDGMVGDVPVEQAVDSAITKLVRTSAAIIALCPSFRVLTADHTYIFAKIHEACFALPATCDTLRVMLLQAKNGGMEKLVRVHPHLVRFGLGDARTLRSASDAVIDCPRLLAARAQRLSLGFAINPHTLGPTPQLIEIELHALQDAVARPPRVLKLATLRTAVVRIPRHSRIGGYPQGVLGKSLGWVGGALDQLRLILDGPAAHLDIYFGAVRIGPKGTIKSIVIEGDVDPTLEGYQAFATACQTAQVSIAVRRCVHIFSTLADAPTVQLQQYLRRLKTAKSQHGSALRNIWSPEGFGPP